MLPPRSSAPSDLSLILHFDPANSQGSLEELTLRIAEWDRILRRLADLTENAAHAPEVNAYRERLVLAAAAAPAQCELALALWLYARGVRPGGPELSPLQPDTPADGRLRTELGSLLEDFRKLIAGGARLSVEAAEPVVEQRPLLGKQLEFLSRFAGPGGGA